MISVCKLRPVNNEHDEGPVQYRECANILTYVLFASFDIINKNCFIPLFMMTYTLLNLII